MYWSDGTVYIGNWHKGKQSGKGCLRLPNGIVREGIFENNKFMGNGTKPEPVIGEEGEENKEIGE